MFTINSQNTRCNAEKIANMTAALRGLAAADSIVILALQEVLSVEAVQFWCDYMTEKTRRSWACVVSPKALGRSSAERAAFMWTQSPRLQVDPDHNFQLLSDADGEKLLKGNQKDPRPGLLRSPFFGLFRVDQANLVLLNVHLAADKTLADAEMRLLHGLAAAVQHPNKRLFRRRAMFGLFKRRHVRGCCIILGDMNCTPPKRTNDPASSVIQAPAGPTKQNQKQQQQRHAGAAGARIAIGNGITASPEAAATAAAAASAAAAQQHRSGTADGQHQAVKHSWLALRADGWTNLLPDDVCTTHRAKQLRHLDDIWLPATLAPLLVRGGGQAQVIRQGEYMKPESYPNHLMVYVELDVRPLQEGIRIGKPKPRPLNLPAALPQLLG